jgi:hypothetical protein
MPEFGRLDYLTREGWVVGHAGIALNDPQRYVDMLAKPQETVARFVPYDGDHQPGEPLVPASGVPDFPSAQGKVPRGLSIIQCAACGDAHKTAWECLL